MATQPTHRISVEEYLEREVDSLERHEYLDGEVFEMVAASLDHALIASNIVAHLNLRTADTDCRVRGDHARIRTSTEGLYSYADVVISCGAEQNDRETLLNPLVIVEVLSPSTSGYDRGTKFERYRQIASFREYLLVAQDRPYVEHHVRAEQHVWMMTEYRTLEDSIVLNAIGVKLSIREIYAKVSFGAVGD